MDETLGYDGWVNSHLRPLERRIQRLRDQGLSDDEIAWRFRRSPGWIRRIHALSQIERTNAPESPDAVLRPVERVVRAGVERGLSTSEIAARLRRSPEWVRRVQGFADYKLARSA